MGERKLHKTPEVHAAAITAAGQIVAAIVARGEMDPLIQDLNKVHAKVHDLYAMILHGVSINQFGNDAN